MEDVYKEIEELSKLNINTINQNKDHYQKKIAEYLKLIEKDDVNKWHFKLNLIALQSSDKEDFDSLKAKCKGIAAALNNPEYEAELLLVLASICRLNKDFECAEKYYQEAISLTKDLSDNLKYYRVELNYATLHINLGNYLEAYKKLVMIEECPNVKQDSALLLNTYLWLADIETKFRNFSKSIKYSELMSQIALDLDNMPAYAIAQSSMGLNYYRSENYELAIIALNNTIKVSKDNVNHFVYAELLHSLGLAYKRLNDLENAEEHFLKALEYAKEHDCYESISNVQSSLGVLYLDQAKYEKAKESLKKALIIRKKIKLESLLIDTYLDYARYFVLTKQYDLASSIIHRAIDKCKEDDFEALKKAYEMLECLYVEKGDYALALKNAKLKNEYFEKNEDQESQQEIEGLRMNFDLDLVRDSMQKKAELEKQKTALNEAVKTIDKIANPVAIIREGLNSMK
ncbi:MAG: tetratricopeptide repeat protein [Candidatus Cloacimonadales bacterium]|jgi:tetratricopeptide (TPR) repeat protein|nr:tetratricopeptide repeat protein [Candidatus Cloacimonadales bacterium]